MIDERSAGWRAQYAEYLASQEWWDKRELVMERAGRVCEGCRQADATEVHHLTYANVTREFLFELVALCHACHERLHAQREEPSKPSASAWKPRERPSEAWKRSIRNGRW